MSIDPGSQDPQRNDLLAMISEGRKVVDIDGDDVGTVSHVQMADVNEPDDLGDRVTERMERSGYVKIDAAGILTGDRFVEPCQIASEGDPVRLGIDRDAIGKPA